MEITDWHDWINKKFLEWRGDTRKGASEFAVYLEISQPTVSAWLNKTRGQPKTQDIINKLVDKYGDEAYRVLYPSESNNIFSNPKRLLFEKVNRMSDKEAEEAIRKLEGRK